MRYHEARRAAAQLADELSDADQIELMRTWLQDHPHRVSPWDVVVVPRFVSVWAIIGQVEASLGDLDDVAEAYEIPIDAVRAALAYYRRFPEVIEARIDANEGTSYLESLV
jgi:uncharacterized protein (DUF433 family)